MLITLPAVSAYGQSALRGDLNGDNTLNRDDRKVLKDLLSYHRKHRKEESYVMPREADINSNGKLGRKDVRILRRLIRRSLRGNRSPGKPGRSLPLTAAPLRMGTNLNGVTYYSPEWVFVDAMKQAGPWISQTNTSWNDGRTILVRSDGGIILEPGQFATTLIYRDIGAHFPAGRYICTYEGKGKITFSVSAQATGESGNRITVDVTPTVQGIALKVEQSDSQDPVRNIKLWLPGFENARSPFHPLFLERIRGFKAIRFMDWQQTNNSKLSSWSDRTLPTFGTQAGPNGVAVEYMADLCNELDADAWVCMPHLADDTFVRSFATLLKARLEPGRKIYLEYSNEVWNGIFQQTHYVIERGQALGLAADKYEAGRRYYARRSVEIFKIWEQVFGGKNRLVRVIASQAANPWLSGTLLDYAGGSANADALAIAPYFYASGMNNRMPGGTVNDVIELCEKFIRTTVVDRLKLNKQHADRHGVAMIAYEGGQHLVEANNTAVTDLYIAANRDPRMYDLYGLYFNAWAAQNEGGLFMNFTTVYQPSKYGSWGCLEYQDQPLNKAHKYRAVRESLDGSLPFFETAEPQMQSLGAYD